MKNESPLKEGNLQAMNRILTAMDSSIDEMIYAPEETLNLMNIKNIDLVKTLNAVVYHAKITNKLCDMKEVIENVEDIYEQFSWTQNCCGNKAISCLKQEESSLTYFFCKEHSYIVDSKSSDYHDLDRELSNTISDLKSMERLLVVVEEQMEYLKSKEINKDMST